MRHLAIFGMLTVALFLGSSPAAAQSAGTPRVGATSVGTGSAGLPTGSSAIPAQSGLTASGGTLARVPSIQRLFKLEIPGLQPLHFSFSDAPTPGYELLRLPTFEARATLWSTDETFGRGQLEVSLFERTAPALELDCMLTCAPILEQAAGTDFRFGLGAITPKIPSSYVFVQPQAMRLPRGFGSRSLLGFGGLLDF
ncbi:MAG TPA: hypothetical protein VFQ61_27015 [Polyangiaceae bacterium]|nr:hypothetical protein [Polyangiaceae bacterium]